MAREFKMTILGRTIEHLGTQMYKHRAPSIVELIANCWDAGAKEVRVTLPTETEYLQDNSVITIKDDGEGMNEHSVERKYLVVGRNRRTEEGATHNGRIVMGRKGIGKLAGFGLAEKVTISTWNQNSTKAIQFFMTRQQLNCEAGKSTEIKFPWKEITKPSDWPSSGTKIELSTLKHSTPIDIQILSETISRRFSRITRGHMRILINDTELSEPTIDTIYNSELQEATLPSGKTVKFAYKFARKPIHSKELQGFVIYANGRTAQAPPFFFNIESTASSQHSTRYVTGEIHADYIDAGTDDDSDITSTDRQELDWEKEELSELLTWGEEIARKTLRDCAEKRGTELKDWILADPDFKNRLAILDDPSQKQVSKFLITLGKKTVDTDERTRSLADSLIRAYEFRNFHDIISDMDEIGDDPDKLEELLDRLHNWKVLESRAILEIIGGRLNIIEKFQKMIIDEAPETASSKTYDNLHDLLAEYPWLFNPEWQVFAEEKSISKILRDKGLKDCPDDMKSKRVDFLAFANDSSELIIIELKRPGHPVDLDELQRLERYQNELLGAWKKCTRVLVYGGTKNIKDEKWQEMLKQTDFAPLIWSNMFQRAKSFYSHYEAVLKGEARDKNFSIKKIEVARTRTILETGLSHRSAEDRKRGLGDSNT